MTTQSAHLAILAPMAEVKTADTRWKSLYRAGSIAALTQLACTLFMFVVLSALGAEPTTAAEYFSVLQQNRLVGLLRLDFASLINVLLYAVTAFGIYAALKRKHEVYAALATALIFLGIALAVSVHSAFSMIYLSDQYAAATTSAQKDQLLIAAQMMIASDWWHSTGGILAGVFMQGGMALMSCIMLRGRVFSKATAYTGILATGLDFVHVLVGLVLPSFGIALLSIGGLFYLAWFPLLARDFHRLSQTAPAGETQPSR